VEEVNLMAHFAHQLVAKVDFGAFLMHKLVARKRLL
jgi:hypothetical protein